MKKILTVLSLSSFLFCGIAMADKPVNVGTSRTTVTTSTSATMPPGLKSMPRGLLKKNKTPHGWSKGKKRGWKKTRKTRSVTKTTDVDGVKTTVNVSR